MKKSALIALFLGMFLIACNAKTPVLPTQQAGVPVLQISSPTFGSMAMIPPQFTCKGAEISPLLQWNAPPANTQSLALLMDDPDAPGGTWVHWVVYNLPAATLSLPEGAAQAKADTANLPDGALQGRNSWNRASYGGPCPPTGQHRYFFRLYALDTLLKDPNLTEEGVMKAIQGHILAQGELVGVFRQ